jgi:ribosomal protein L3 glutamine methyltransferase
MRSAERAADRRPAPITLGRLIREGARRFRAARLSFGHGIARASDEAAYLALHALKMHPDALQSALAAPLSPTQVRRINALFGRRIRERKPAAYLTREAWLGDYRFYVDERVIVPRSYIAELLRDDLKPWVAQPLRTKSALDLCTGSGCLAILLAHSFPSAKIDAIDISADALRVARRNVAAYHLASRIRLLRSDLFAGVAGKRYELIVSNPPYVRKSVMDRLPTEYRKEPRLALAGGTDGLDIVRDILRHATGYLSPKGILVVEVGHNRTRVEKAFPRLELTWLSTSGGDDCVFLLEREQLCRWQAVAETV